MECSKISIELDILICRFGELLGVSIVSIPGILVLLGALFLSGVDSFSLFSRCSLGLFQHPDMEVDSNVFAGVPSLSFCDRKRVNNCASDAPIYYTTPLVFPEQKLHLMGSMPLGKNMLQVIIQLRFEIHNIYLKQ